MHSNGCALPELRLYLETALDGKPLRPVTMDDLLLFVKLYDPVKESLSFLGRFLTKPHYNVQQLVPLLNRKAGFPEGTSLEVCRPISSALYYAVVVLVVCVFRNDKQEVA